MKACPTCNFSLWLPISPLTVSSWGLYNDDRFPGRSIVSLTSHYEHLHEVPGKLLTSFMEDVQQASRSIMELPLVKRVNVAVLGNTVSHVHAHLIPRYPGEAFPGKSPWDDPRPKGELPLEGVERLTAFLRENAG